MDTSAPRQRHQPNLVTTTDQKSASSDNWWKNPSDRFHQTNLSCVQDIRCEKAFHIYLTEDPVLAYADPSKFYELHVDASWDGLGGVLYQ